MSETREAVQWERVSEHAANSHKNHNNGHLVDLPEKVADIEGNPTNLAAEGGAFFVQGMGGQALLVTVRHPGWRNTENDPQVHTSDIMLVHGLNHAERSLTEPPQIATEVEGFVINPVNSEPISAETPGDPHPELFSDCIEEATATARTMFGAAMQTVEAYKRLWARAKRVGGIFYPGSNIAHRARTVDDINSDPYVGRVVRKLGERNHLGLEPAEALTWLDGASVQTHIERELSHENAAFALNTHATIISPLTMSLTAASAFSRGDYLPEFIGAYAGKKSKVGYMATRFFGRMIGSPEAGPLRKFIHEDPDTHALEINRRMKNGDINNPGRVGNQHGDVRARHDLAPQGDNELCAKDSNGGHIESTMAIGDYERTFLHVVSKARKEGRIEELAQKYPLVVTEKLYEREEELLLQARLNSEVLAEQELAEAIISGINGEPCRALDALSQSVKMCQEETKRKDEESYRLSDGTLRWIKIRAGRPSYTAINKEDVRNGKSMPFATMRRFYNGEPGTFAHYQRIRVSQLMLHDGMNKSAAIAQMQIEASICHEEYMRKLHPDKDLAFLKKAA